MKEVEKVLTNPNKVIQYLRFLILDFRFKKITNHKSQIINLPRARALIQIQDGCDNYCAYCAIVAARGRSKNHPADQIIEVIKRYEKQGFTEVMLTGINIGAYGASSTKKPKESRLAELLEQILDETKIRRIRLGSLGPQYFSENLFRILKNPRICRHIHLSIQSGSDPVLKRMGRRYSVEDVERVIRRLQKDIPGVAITTDIIVGFPEETEAEFKETLDFVERNKLSKIHVFPYSIRPNTVAAKMKQVSENVKKERAKKLEEVGHELRRQFIKSQLGKIASVLWHKELKPGVWEGLTENYIKIVKKGDMKRRVVTKEVVTEENVVWE